MRKKLSIALCLLISGIILSQIKSEAGGYKFKSGECITENQRQLIMGMLEKNKQILIKENKLHVSYKVAHPLFIWPVIKNPLSNYNNVWSISNHVDHNYPNQLVDWNCGGRTYNNHKGVDIFTWPFPWYMMDTKPAWVVAAASGIIIGKSDGNYDRNCSYTNPNWNAVYIQHTDGSVAWYGHMMQNSLTFKNVGDHVAVGEYLGTVGSSGSSTGPHLHFEVYNDINQLVDPYLGSCNTWPSSTNSWWEIQKPYIDPKINQVSTHSGIPVFNNGCGVQETTKYKNTFNVGETVYVFLFGADIPIGEYISIKLIRPDLSIAHSSTIAQNIFFYSSWRYWQFSSSTLNQVGIWTAEITVNNQTVTHQFGYGMQLDINEISANAEKNIAVENPVKNNKLNIINNSKIDYYIIDVYTIDGRKIKSEKIWVPEKLNYDFNFEKGIYLLKIHNKKSKFAFKIIN